MAQAVDYKIVVPSRHLFHPSTFLKNFQFANDHERQFLKHLSKLASDNKVRIWSSRFDWTVIPVLSGQVF
jgi:hypothetical protein